MALIKQYKPKDENVKKLIIFLNKLNDDRKEIKRVRNGNKSSGN